MPPAGKPLAALAKAMTELSHALADYHYHILPEPKPERMEFLRSSRIREQVDRMVHAIGRRLSEQYRT